MCSLFFRVVFFLLIAGYCFSVAESSEVYENAIKLADQKKEANGHINNYSFEDNAKKRSVDIATGSNTAAGESVGFHPAVEKDKSNVSTNSDLQAGEKHFRRNGRIFGNGDAQGFNNYPNLNGSLSMADSSSAFGTYEEANKLYGGYDLVDMFREEIRAKMEDDVYEKAVWTYAEIKDMNNWINSTMAQYGFGQGALPGKQEYSIVGLDGLLNVMAIFQQNDSTGLFLQDDGNKFLNTGASGDKALLIEDYQDRQADAQGFESKFYVIFKYLTIINIIYAFLGMAFVVIVIKAFKFLVRQQ